MGRRGGSVMAGQTFLEEPEWAYLNPLGGECRGGLIFAWKAALIKLTRARKFFDITCQFCINKRLQYAVLNGTEKHTGAASLHNVIKRNMIFLLVISKPRLMYLKSACVSLSTPLEAAGFEEIIVPLLLSLMPLKAETTHSLGYDALSANVPSLPLFPVDCLPDSLSTSSSSSDLPRLRCLRHTGGLQGSTHTHTDTDTDTDTALYHHLATYSRNKTVATHNVGGENDGLGWTNQFKLWDYTPQAVNNTSHEVCWTYVHVVIVVFYRRFIFYTSEKCITHILGLRSNPKECYWD